MQAEGLITRHAPPHDRCKTVVAVTEAGEQLIRAHVRKTPRSLARSSTTSDQSGWTFCWTCWSSCRPRARGSGAQKDRRPAARHKLTSRMDHGRLGRPRTDKAMTEHDFDLERFLPYQLNQAAEATSLAFQTFYRAGYGMTRTQWRVMANLGKFGAMTARDICARSHIEKTKASRAIAALEAEGRLTRTRSAQDRRAEILSLTPAGLAAFYDLGQRAIDYDRSLRASLTDSLGAAVSAQLDALLANLTRQVRTDQPEDQS
jgi:DNA-binding MarR family transcriptional regulator